MNRSRFHVISASFAALVILLSLALGVAGCSPKEKTVEQNPQPREAAPVTMTATAQAEQPQKKEPAVSPSAQTSYTSATLPAPPAFGVGYAAVDGVLKYSDGVGWATVPPDAAMAKTLNTVGLSMIATGTVATASPNNVAANPTWFVIDHPYLYSISKGSYKAENKDRAVLDIFLIGNASLQLLSSTQVGVSGVQVRGIDYLNDTLYLADWNASIYVYDIANRTTPSLVTTFGSASDGGVQMLHVINSLLCVPHWNGKIDFYSLKEPRSPAVVKSFDKSATSAAMVQMLPLGNYVWCIGYASSAGRQNLHCFDLSNAADPLLVSSSIIPELTFARYGDIDDGILYAGGFAETSRVCAIDLRNPSSPVLLKMFSFNLSSLIKVGNCLIGPDASGHNGTYIVDIADWNNPVSSSFYASALYYPKILGNIFFAFKAGTLPKPPEAAPNDSARGEALLMAALTVPHLASAQIHSSRAHGPKRPEARATRELPPELPRQHPR